MNYSFTPPTFIPLIKYFCTNGNIISNGINAITTPAIFTLLVIISPVEPASLGIIIALNATGSVYNFESVIYSSGAVNSFHLLTNSNNVTIGGFVNGKDGQVIQVVVEDASNNATLEHSEGTGNQDIFLSSGADETRTASYGGWTLVCNGSNWYEVDN